MCFAVFFPLILLFGASGKITNPYTDKICRFLGNISYPLYMVHYPFIYLYYAWVKNEKLSFLDSLPGALAVVIGSILLAWLCLKLYDELVRKHFTALFLKRKVLPKGNSRHSGKRTSAIIPLLPQEINKGGAAHKAPLK